MIFKGRYFNVTGTNVSIDYNKNKLKIDINDIKGFDVKEKRFYFYDILRLLLVALLVPLVFFHEQINSNYIPIYSLILFCSLFSKYNQKIFTFCIFLKDEKVSFNVNSKDCNFFLDESLKVQDCIYKRMMLNSNYLS